MTIPANKKRFPIVFLAGLIGSNFIILQIAKTIKHFNDKGYDNSIYLGVFIGLCICALYLTIIAFLDYLKTLFDKNAALMITDSGVNDNLSIFSVGDISWSDITGIEIMTMLNTSFLVIRVTNPQSFINRKSIFKRRTLKSFLKRFGSPIVISQKRIDYNLGNLKEILLRAKSG